MHYLKSGLLFSFLLFTISSCAQGKYGIKKIQAFHRQQLPGTIKAPVEGEPELPMSDTIHIIYIETKGPTATWESAWWRDKSYSVSASRVMRNKEIAGKDNMTGKTITVSASKGNQLWVLYLNADGQERRPPALKKKDEILLQGKFGTKVITQLIKSTRQLQLIPSV